MSFLDLVDGPQELNPADRQQWAAEQFADSVDQSHLTIWSPGQPVPATGWRLLLGVAPAWNRYDLALLDVIESKLAADSREDVCVQVFDADQCQSVEEIEQFIPGLQNPIAHPLVGIWSAGEHDESLFGHAGRQRVLEMLKIPYAEYDEILKQNECASSPAILTERLK